MALLTWDLKKTGAMMNLQAKESRDDQERKESTEEPKMAHSIWDSKQIEVKTNTKIEIDRNHHVI